MKQLLSILILLLFGFSPYAQVLITDADYTSTGQGECACSTTFNDGSIQNFFDSGGTGGSYGPNENDTITFCPDGTGTKVFVAFGINMGYTLDVDGSDTIFIFDGPDATYPPLDTVNSVMTPNGIPATSASWSNLSGCLTIVFVSDGAIEGTGWDANIACGNLAQPFFPHMEAFINGQANGANDLLSDLNPLDTGYLDVCFGDSILFTATPYFPYEPGGDSASPNGAGYAQSTNHTLEWTFSDGTTATGNNIWFSPPARNGYFITLKTMDSFGTFQYLFCKVRVSTIPSFVTCEAIPTEFCLGDIGVLVGGVTSTDTAGVDPVPATFPIGGVFAAQTYLPDGSGQNYTTTINIAGFVPGDTLVNATDIDKICISMEHSYLGDLEMMLTCPNGTSVDIFNAYLGNGLFPGGFGGGGTYLGGAYDNNTGNIGVCEEYCFSNVSGAMPAWVNGYNTTAATGPSAGNMIVPGTYEPEETFGNLAGCDINGTWTITVRDNQGIDDGYICEWGIYFIDSLNPSNEIYVTEIVNEFWHPDSTIVQDLNNDTTIFIRPDSVGTWGYTFEVMDSYGCSYDTTITVNVIQGPQIMPSTSACYGDWIQFSNTYAPLGGGWWAAGPDSSSFAPTQTAANPSFYGYSPGVYTVYFADNQCGDTLTNEITIFGYPQVTIVYDGSDTVTQIILCSDDNIVINSIGTNVDNYSWTPWGTTDSILIEASTIYIPPVSGATQTTSQQLFVIEASNFCASDYDSVMVIVEDCAIPNVITPNGDGMNDVFFTNYAKYYKDVELVIYNRWGKVVYKTSAYDNTWSGEKKNSGNKVSAGTYFYVMQWDKGTKDANGTINVFDPN